MEPEATEPGEEPGEAGEGGDPAPETEQSPDAARAEAAPGAGQISAQWSAMMQELKRNRQALTAAVYEEARVTGFDGAVLKLTFPEEQSFYVGMANERKHADELGKVLEHRLGSRPRLEIGVYDGNEPPFSSKPSPEPEPDEPTPEPRPESVEEPAEQTPPASEPIRPEDSAQTGADNTDTGAEGKAQSSAAGSGGADDIIRDPREVVEMARQRFASSDRERGGGS